jgi:co-chaperonin GroES (HSP10)
MTNIPFQPLFARVLLQREKVQKIGTILLPATTSDRYNPDEGTLIAVGHTVEPEIADYIGKKVMFAKYSGAWIKVKDEEYFLCQEDDLLGVVTNE